TGSSKHPYDFISVDTEACVHGHAKHPHDFISSDPSCQIESGDSPIAVDDAYTGTENHLLVSDPSVLANDSDPNGDPLTAVLVTNGAHGFALMFPDGTFTYTPDRGYSGPDSITYRANDGSHDSNVATVSITLAPDILTAGNDAYAGTEN